MGHITDALLNLHGPVIYGVVAALVFAEAALFLGFVFPGETAVVIAGVLASQQRVSLPILLGVIALSAIIGDSVGYEVGRRFGDRLLDLKPVSRHRAKVDRAHGLLRRRGAYAVFIGRFTALLRALMPALAGSARMPYGRFLVFNALGGITWGVGFATGGFLVGTAFEQVAQWAGRLLAIVVGVIAAVALLVWSIRRRRQEKAGHGGDTGGEGDAGPGGPAGRDGVPAGEPEPAPSGGNPGNAGADGTPASDRFRSGTAGAGATGQVGEAGEVGGGGGGARAHGEPSEVPGGAT